MRETGERTRQGRQSGRYIYIYIYNQRDRKKDAQRNRTIVHGIIVPLSQSISQHGQCELLSKQHA